jgi:catechol 2,3-dioxygenase-like lactoylglutathione lyase family enzyme
LDFRRTTLVVSDIERSLAFYRDALGMVVTYDNLIFKPRDAGSVEAAERASRLIFLRANDDFIGVLGLIQYLKPDRGSLDIRDKAFHTGTTILVMNHENARGAYERAVAVPGTKSMWEPSETAYPSYDGTGKIRVLTSGVQDPDGFVIEINELLDELN